MPRTSSRPFAVAAAAAALALIAAVFAAAPASARPVSADTDAALDTGVAGLVLVGTGAGNVHGSLKPGIERALAADVPVVVTSRCWSGPVLPEYGGDLGGWTLDAMGCVLAGDLPTGKARVALWVALGVDPSPDAVRAWFAELLDSAGR